MLNTNRSVLQCKMTATEELCNADSQCAHYPETRFSSPWKLLCAPMIVSREWILIGYCQFYPSEMKLTTKLEAFASVAEDESESFKFCCQFERVGGGGGFVEKPEGGGIGKNN